MNTDTPQKQAARRETIIKVAAIVGLAAIVVFGLWVGSLKVGNGVPRSSLSSSALLSFFKKHQNGLSTTTPPTASTTQPVATGPVGGDNTAPVPPALYGNPDLAIYYLDSGKLDFNNQFVATTVVGRSEHAAIRFAVKNVGTNASGTWKFSAVVPGSSFSLFSSDLQGSLLPGERIEYTLGFDNAKIISSGATSVSIVIDPQSQTSDNVRTNNFIVSGLNVVAN